MEVKFDDFKEVVFMLHQSAKNKIYRFPGHESILDFEKDHPMYCPPASSLTSLDGFSYDSYSSITIPLPTTYSESTHSTYS